MKTVVYKTDHKLECGCGDQIVLGVPAALVAAANTPFLFATIQYSQYHCRDGGTTWTYFITYDETALVDPARNLQPTDIVGVICGGLIANYIAYIVQQNIVPAGEASFQPIWQVPCVSVTVSPVFSNGRNLTPGTKQVIFSNQLNQDLLVSADHGASVCLYVPQNVFWAPLDLKALGLTTSASLTFAVATQATQGQFTMMTIL